VCLLAGVVIVFAAAPATSDSIASGQFFSVHSRVVVVHDPDATETFDPRIEKLRPMVEKGLTLLTGKSSMGEAWRSLLSSNDIVGIKVHSQPGARSGTRPAVVAALVEGLISAGIARSNIIVWDKQLADLRKAGFSELETNYHIRLQGAVDAGYDEKAFYETSLLGQLIYGDREFGQKGETVGRKSFVSRLVSREITKLINVSPLLNHYRAGVTGNLYSLAMGSVDNTARFDMDVGRLAQAVPEIYALPELSDKVVLNVVDALLCQYQGEHAPLLHYSSLLNELRFSTDPVALDVLSMQALDRQRGATGGFPSTNRFELYSNAALLELGISDPASIRVERAEMKN
jgi:hypothetical protein